MSVKSLGDPVFSLQMQALEMKVKLRENIEIHIWGPRHLLLAFKIMAFILCSSLNCQLLLNNTSQVETSSIWLAMDRILFYKYSCVIVVSLKLDAGGC